MYGWANESLDVDRDLPMQPGSTAYPSIPAEIPGVELESDYEDITSAIEEDTPLELAGCAASTRRNSSIEPAIGTQDETSRVDGAAVIDLTGEESDPEEVDPEQGLTIKREEEPNDEASENSDKIENVLTPHMMGTD